MQWGAWCLLLAALLPCWVGARAACAAAARRVYLLWGCCTADAAADMVKLATVQFTEVPSITTIGPSCRCVDEVACSCDIFDQVLCFSVDSSDYHTSNCDHGLKVLVGRRLIPLKPGVQRARSFLRNSVQPGSHPASLLPIADSMPQPHYHQHLLLLGAGATVACCAVLWHHYTRRRSGTSLVQSAQRWLSRNAPVWRALVWMRVAAA